MNLVCHILRRRDQEHAIAAVLLLARSARTRPGMVRHLRALGTLLHEELAHFEGDRSAWEAWIQDRLRPRTGMTQIEITWALQTRTPRNPTHETD